MISIPKKLVRIAASFVMAAILATPLSAAAEPSPPDFTQGDSIPAGALHDWNLGATGLRGWIFSDQLETTQARQIAITKVDHGSPAAGIVAVGDVILGVGGKRFVADPRTEFGKALSLAESAEGDGKLILSRWRAGQIDDVALKLPMLGSYSATAPYACPKSKRILDLGCKALAARIAQPSYEQDPIPRSLNALALLASGDPAYLPLVKKEAQWAAHFSCDSMQTWYYGYVVILLSEYVLATNDRSVMPGLKRLALEAAKNQSAVGSWGHGFALPDGRLGGYGMMNSPGLALTIALVMARKAGVKDPAMDRAIDLSASLLSFYIGKGAIPYGDHHPWIENHEDNGKCGMAAVLFNLLGDAKGAEFFSRMSIASHGAERDTGHTGNFFNILWAIPGVSQSGPSGTGAWMSEFGGRYFDLARRWDGSFAHQGPPEIEDDSYLGWDATGGYLLACAMPLKKIYLTGKVQSVAPQITPDVAQNLILDGRGWSPKDGASSYYKLNEEQLFERLSSWSPVVRERAATALAYQSDVAGDGEAAGDDLEGGEGIAFVQEVPIPRLLKMLEAPDLYSRYGACQALIALRDRAAPALETLEKTLDAPDLWLRIKAAEALAAIGASARRSAPKLLKLLTQVDIKNDPRGMQQRYLTFALFDQGGEHEPGMLSASLDGVDRDLLYQAVRAGLMNQDGRARGAIGSVYHNLSAIEIKPILPAIYRAIVDPAPSGEMFADEIRIEGLSLLSKHRIKEGMSACVQYARTQNPWASEIRTPVLMDLLLSYGAHAKSAIPELTKLADYFANDEKDFPEDLMLMKAEFVREAIHKIEASTDYPELNLLFTPDVIKIYSTGMSFTVDAKDIAAPNGGMLSQFTKAPSLFSSYFGLLDIRRAKPILATHKAVAFRKNGVPVAKLSALTPGDQLTAEITVAPLFYDKKNLAAHYAAGGHVDTFSQVEWIDMDLSVQISEVGAAPSKSIGELRLTRPELSSLSSLDRLPATQLKAGQMLRLEGKYFGKKLPKVYLEYTVLGKTKTLDCTVLKYTPFPDASGKPALSCTDPVSGASAILVEMPKAWPKEWIHGSNDLVLGNGSALVTLKVVTNGSAITGNSAPVAMNDSVQAPLARTTLIDVLANDHDSDNQALKIVLVGKPLYGKLSLSNNAVLYTPAPGTALGTKDSFSYFLQESTSAEKFKSSVATVHIDVVAALSNLPDNSVDADLPLAPDLNLFLAPGESLSRQLLLGVSSTGPIRLDEVSCPEDDFDLGTIGFTSEGAFNFTAADHLGRCVLDYVVSNESGETTGHIYLAVGQRVCAGMSLKLAASEVPTAVQDELAQFNKAPMLYSSGLNLFTDAAPKALTYKHKFIRGFDANDAGIAKLSALAPSDSLLFECGANLPLCDKKALALHYAKGGSVRDFKAYASEALMPLYFKNTDLSQHPLIFCAPVLERVLIDGTSLTIEGKYFGKVLPKVYFEYTDAGQTKMLPCTVLKTYDFPDASGTPAAIFTDHATGASRLHLRLPKKLPKQWFPGKLTLVLDSGSGLAAIEVEM